MYLAQRPTHRVTRPHSTEIDKVFYTRYNERNGACTSKTVPNASSARKRQIGQASLSFFRSWPQFLSHRWYAEYRIDTTRYATSTARRYRRKEEEKRRGIKQNTKQKKENRKRRKEEIEKKVAAFVSSMNCAFLVI